LLDAGIPYKELQVKSKFKVNEVSACLVSHEHGDHARAVKELLKGAIDVYALPDTLSALGVAEHHRAHDVEPLKTYTINTFEIMPVTMHHDVPCVGYMVYSKSSGERLLFATDTYKITINPQAIDYLIVEVNYQKEIVNKLVNEGKMEASIRARLLFSHYELSKAIKWLNKIDKSRLKRIYVAHLSGGHSDAEKIKNAIIGETGIPTTICDA
jgi:phosphoribosyl 1,2-cyclic phosphodiesterase